MATKGPGAIELATVRRYCRSGIARAIRESADLRLADVARELGVSAESVSAWETCKQRPTGRHALAYLDLLNSLGRSGDDKLYGLLQELGEWSP
jgi:DNA-binding transcriptional regulator YiaG